MGLTNPPQLNIKFFLYTRTKYPLYLQGIPHYIMIYNQSISIHMTNNNYHADTKTANQSLDS